MKVVGKMFGKRPEVMEIGTELKDLQDFVGGYIEVPFISPGLRERNIVVVVNEEGKLKGLQPTMALVHDGEVLDCLVGQIFFCSTDEDDFASLNDEQIKYIMDNIVFDGASNNDGLEVDVLFV